MLWNIIHQYKRTNNIHNSMDESQRHNIELKTQYTQEYIQFDSIK